MKTKKIIAFILVIIALVSVCSFECFAYPFSDYIISYENEVLASAKAAEFEKSIRGEDIGVGAFSDSMCIRMSNDGKIVIADTGNSRVIVTDQNYKLLYIISEFDNNGKEDKLSKPQGVFVSFDNKLFIADTENSRILLFNLLTGEFDREFPKPNSPLLEEDYVYAPTALAVDANGRMYVIARNVNQGLMAFNANGVFVGFIGANKVEINPIQQMLKRFSTEEQIERMNQSTPTEYNNITIDSEGFIYTTTATIPAGNIESAIRSKSKDDRYAPIKKLNGSGVDVLLREGAFMPVGDTAYINSKRDVFHVSGQSNLVDVTLGTAGTYAVLDNKRGRIFKYDDRGNMLYEFGGLSETDNGLVNPVSFTSYKERFLIMDIGRDCIVEYSETRYGSLIQQALYAYSEGDYDTSNTCWKEVLKTNSNCEIAYNGLGLIAYHNKDYKIAKDYFLMAKNRENYSKAYKNYRTEWLTDNFTNIAVVLSVLLATFAIVLIILKIRSKYRMIVKTYYERHS